MAPSLLNKQIAGCNSLYDWMMSLAINLAALYDTYVEVIMVPMGIIWLFSVLI